VKQISQVTPLDGYPTEIGRWLWALEDVRRITRRAVDGLGVATLDWRGPDGSENSIGSLLYHIANVEIGWLFFDVLGTGLPDELKSEFPYEAWMDGAITHVGGLALEEHVGRLERTRAVFLERLREMDLADFRRLNAPEGEDYECTLEWVVYHLIEHEAGHAYQMRSLRRRAKAALLATADPVQP
jgi:uncharacterized damage-inducible protein DinB